MKLETPLFKLIIDLLSSQMHMPLVNNIFNCIILIKKSIVVEEHHQLERQIDK